MDDELDTDLYEQEEMKAEAIQSPAEKLQSELAQFCGSEDFYKSSCLCRWMYHTDGVQYLADHAKCFWLIDAILSHQTNARVRSEPFQVWKLTVDLAKRTADLTCTDGDKGNGPVTLARQHIGYTDFPLPEITLYLEEGSLDGQTTSKILMLPNER